MISKRTILVIYGLVWDLSNALLQRTRRLNWHEGAISTRYWAGSNQSLTCNFLAFARAKGCSKLICVSLVSHSLSCPWISSVFTGTFYSGSELWRQKFTHRALAWQLLGWKCFAWSTSKFRPCRLYLLLHLAAGETDSCGIFLASKQ
jgi:hypothetical protein